MAVKFNPLNPNRLRKRYPGYGESQFNTNPLNKIDSQQFGQFSNTGGLKNYNFNTTMPSNSFNPDFTTLKPATEGAGGVIDSIGGLANKVGGFLSSPAGAMGMGALGGVVGGLLGNQEIKSQNAAINKSIGTMENQLNDLKQKRIEATQFRRGEASDFLANYVTARDPNRSAQISQMYQASQDRFRNELQQNDAMQAQYSSQLAQLQSQKQKQKNGWEIAGEGALGAAQLLPYALMG